MSGRGRGWEKSFNEAVADLESRKESKINLGLDRLLAVLSRLGAPQEKIRVIHVAGTNAKGSVTKMLHSAFLAAGYSAGAYYSPHLYSACERIQTSKGLISKSDFARLYRVLLKTPGQEKLTYFEMMTALAFLYFAQKKSDPVILETGLGGRLDATNACRKPILAIVSSIGMDHMDWLGGTIEKIAAEKGGIFKEGVPALVGMVPKKAGIVLRKIARDKKVPEIRFIRSGLKPSKLDWKKGTQVFKSEGQEIRLPMLGKAQGRNVSLVLEALKILNCGDPKGLANAKLPGRWDIRFVNKKPWVFDVGHNEQAVEAFLETLKTSPWKNSRPKLAIVGFLKDKDYPSMMRRIKPYFNEFIVTQLEGDRAADAREVLKVLGSGIAVSSVKGAVALAQKRQAAFTAVLGSFRLVAPVLNL